MIPNQDFNNMNFNPVLFQNFMNMMMLMNPNLINNMQMNTMYQNFYQMNQNNPNFLQQFAYYPQSTQNIIVNGGVMPRPNNNQNSNGYQELFPNYIGPKLNILFETGAGHKLNVPTPTNVTVEELLIKYITRVGVSPSLLGKKIFFLVNGKTIPIHEKTKTEQFFGNLAYGANNQIKVIVIDASNVIGA